MVVNNEYFRAIPDFDGREEWKHCDKFEQQMTYFALSADSFDERRLFVTDTYLFSNYLLLT